MASFLLLFLLSGRFLVREVEDINAIDVLREIDQPEDIGAGAVESVAVLHVPAEILRGNFDGETLKAIYWLLLAVPTSRLANVFLITNDPEGDAEYAAFLANQASLKK